MLKQTCISSLGVGIANAITFNPFDRALYLSVIHHRPFLHRENFRHPFQGFQAVFFQRIISGASYFFFRDMVSLYNDNKPQTAIISGFLNGTIQHPIVAIKSQMWNHSESLKSFRHITMKMFKLNKASFFYGIIGTILRDVVFALTYETTRKNSFQYNLMAGIFATCISSPFNYVRNIQLKTKISGNDQQKSIIQIFKDLYYETIPKENKVKFVLIQRFQMGWGSLRVGLGMAFAEFIRSYLWVL